MISPRTLQKDQQVLLQSIKTKHWNIPATIVEVRDSGRSAWVKTSSGRKYFRNRRFMRTPPDPIEEDDESQSECDDDDEEDEEDEDEEEELLSALAFSGCRRTSSSPNMIPKLSLRDSHKVRFRLLCKNRALKDDSGAEECKGTIISTDADTKGSCCRQHDSIHPLCIYSISVPNTH
jgi:hypothetical protein